MESIASGLLEGINASNKILNEDELNLPNETMIGALMNYIITPNEKFQPMNANFGILPELGITIKDKKERYRKLAERSLNKVKEIFQ